MYMTRALPLLLLATLVACAGAGSSQTPTTVTGTWTATFTNTTTGQQALGFTLSMAQNGTALGINIINFTVPSSCFGSGSVISGELAGVTGTTSGGVSGMIMDMDMWSSPDRTGNHLNLQAQINSHADGARGAYTLTGVTSDCNSQAGTVSLTRIG